MRFKSLFAAAFLLALPATVFAHDVVKGPNGGQVVDDQGHHVEFTVKGDQIELYFADSGDQPIATKGATGRVIVQDGAKQSTVELAAIEPNLMTTKVDAPLKAGTKLVISVKLSDGHDVKARFVAK